MKVNHVIVAFFTSQICLLMLLVKIKFSREFPNVQFARVSRVSTVVSTVTLSLSHWYPGSGVVLDCIDS